MRRAPFSLIMILVGSSCRTLPTTSGDASPEDGGDASADDAISTDSSDASQGAVGPSGGSVTLLHFAAFGDVRPPTENSTSAYPTTTISSIMGNLHDLSAQFAVASGDYIFANTSSAVAAQIDLLQAAEAMYGGTIFHGMGNHECTGGTTSNCPAGTETANVQAFLARLNVGRATPYFDWVVGTSLGDAHFIATAPNAWSTAQQSWLATALAQSATYTFVLAHEPPTGSQGPGSSSIDSMVAARAGGVTLRLYGHTHEYRKIGVNQVIDGNAGAPLAGTGSTGDYYGFGIIDQRADGNIVFTGYQVGTPPMAMESFVVTPAGIATR